MFKQWQCKQLVTMFTKDNRFLPVSNLTCIQNNSEKNQLRKKIIQFITTSSSIDNACLPQDIYKRSRDNKTSAILRTFHSFLIIFITFIIWPINIFHQMFSPFYLSTLSVELRIFWPHPLRKGKTPALRGILGMSLNGIWSSGECGVTSSLPLLPGPLWPRM